MEIKKELGINHDYILAISDNNGRLNLEHIDIERHEALIDNIIDMFNDSQFDASDLYRFAKKQLNYCGLVFPFCLGHSYYDSYIEDVAFPEFDVNAYSKAIYEARERIENAYNKGYDNYAMRLQSKLNKTIRETKEEYIKNILPYIYSYDYNEALKTNKIKERYKIFSSEIHGRFTYETDVNEDLKISTRTNFCYGSSTYFHIIVTYKDIELLPYSEWVKYYYAGYNSIMRFTRSYLANRDSWGHALEFVVNYVNSAIEDADSFVKTEVMKEVNDLLLGLESIFSLNDSEYKERLEVRHIEDDDVRYIGISSARHANDRERENYKIKPSESAMIFRMEKISGALYFLKSLSKLSEIYSEVRTVIERIIDLNKLIYPEVREAIPPIKQEIRNLNIELKPIERTHEYKEKRLDNLKERLEKILDKVDYSKREEEEKAFRLRNPLLDTLEKEVPELWRKINEYKTLIYNREKVLSRLESFQELIEDTVNNN